MTKSNESSRTNDVERVHTKADPDMPSMPTIAGLVPVTAIMTRDVMCVRADFPAEQVIDLIVDNYIGCLPVIDEDGCPIGMITKRDLVEPFASQVRLRRVPSDEPATASMIMLPIALSLDEHATVLQAAAAMARQDMHHIVVVSPKGRVVGVVSSLDIVRWLVRNDGVDVATRSCR